jgi:hypothetical protein
MKKRRKVPGVSLSLSKHDELLMKYVLVIFIISITAISYSQEYTPFDFDNGIWITNYDSYGGPTYEYQYFCLGDTLINQRTFHKLFQYSYRWHWVLDTTFKYYGAITNDSLNRKVELIHAGQIDPIVLYNFDLEIGDTITEGIGEGPNLVVSEIDSIQMCGRYHKRYVIERNYGGWGDLSFTEGIGFSFGFVEPLVLFPFETTSDLVCYTEKDNSECNECQLLLDASLRNNRSYSIAFPNPATTHIIIELKNPENRSHQLIIYDNLGRLVLLLEDLFDSQIELNVENYKSGIFYYKLLNIEDGYRSSGKFMIE